MRIFRNPDGIASGGRLFYFPDGHTIGFSIFYAAKGGIGFLQLEREIIAERIRDNMHELAKTGRWLGGNTPTGFQTGAVSKETVDGKTRKTFMLIPIKEEAELVRTIFELYRQKDSLTKNRWPKEYTGKGTDSDE